MQARQLDAMIRQDRYQTEHQEYLLAQIAAAVINGGMRAPKKPIKVSELMPSRMRQKPQPSRVNRQKVADDVRNVMAMFTRG